jgi:hypothetical protein
VRTALQLIDGGDRSDDPPTSDVRRGTTPRWWRASVVVILRMQWTPMFFPPIWLMQHRLRTMREVSVMRALESMRSMFGFGSREDLMLAFIRMRDVREHDSAFRTACEAALLRHRLEFQGHPVILDEEIIDRGYAAIGLIFAWKIARRRRDSLPKRLTAW